MEKRRIFSSSRFAKSMIPALLLGMALSGCSNSKSSANLQLTMPDWQAERESQAYLNQKITALSAPAGTTAKAQMSRLMLNISGPATKAEHIVIWEDRGQYPAAPEADKLSFELTAGQEALVQVLAVTKIYYVNAAGTAVGHSDDELFYYGDARKVLTSGAQGIEIAVNSIDLQGTGGEGSISGRWKAAGQANGPTAKVYVKFHPPSNPTHPMVIMESEMHGGWFDVMSLSGAKFSYWFADGTALFPGIQTTADGLPAVAGIRRLKAVMPAAFENKNGTAQATSPTYFVGGFFGGGFETDGSKEVCFNGNVGVVSNRYLTTALTALLPWSGSGLPLTSEAGVTQGGKSTGCATNPATYFTDWLVLDQARLSRDDGNVFGFRGPFRWFLEGATRKLISATASSGNLTVKWSMLPGTTGADRVSSVGIFTRTLPATLVGNNNRRELETDSGIACNRLTSLAIPFTEVAAVPVSTENVTLERTISGVNANAFAEGRVEVIVCAKGAKGYFDAGVDYRGSSQNNPATALKLSYLDGSTSLTAATPIKLSSLACTPIQVTTVDASGNPAGASGSHPVSLTLSDSTSTQFYYDEGCQGSAYTSISTSPFSRSRIYVKTTLSPSMPVSITATDSGAAPLTVSTLHLLTKTKEVPAIIRTFAPASIKAHSCVSVDYQLADTTDIPTDPNAGSIYFNGPNVAGLSIFTDNNCNGVLASGSDFNFLSGVMPTNRGFSFIYTGTAASIDLAGVSSGGAIATSPKVVNVTQPGTPVALSLSLNSSMTANVCQLIQVGLVDSNFNTAPALGAVLVTLTAPANGQFYPNLTSCNNSSPTTTTATIAVGTTKQAVYYRHTVAATGVVLGVSASGYVSTSTPALTVTAP